MLCVVVQKSTERSKELKLLFVGCFILLVRGPYDNFEGKYKFYAIFF